MHQAHHRRAATDMAFLGSQGQQPSIQDVGRHSEAEGHEDHHGRRRGVAMDDQREHENPACQQGQAQQDIAPFIEPVGDHVAKDGTDGCKHRHGSGLGLI